MNPHSLKLFASGERVTITSFGFFVAHSRISQDFYVMNLHCHIACNLPSRSVTRGLCMAKDRVVTPDTRPTDEIDTFVEAGGPKVQLQITKTSEPENPKV